jgi:transposase-like protein
MTVSLIARKYGLFPSKLFYWRRLRENGALTGIKAEEEVVPVSEYKVMEKQVRELERALGRDGRFPIRAIARVLKVARSNLIEQLSPTESAIFPLKEEELIEPIKALVSKRPTYSYRRIGILLRRKLKQKINHKIRNTG